MKNKLLSACKFFLPIMFWILIWEIIALLVNHDYFLPSVPKTFIALFEIVKSKSFFKTVFSTLLRVLWGLILGIAFGVILSFISYKFTVIRSLVTPLISVIKSTPVATFIIIFWVMLSGEALPIVIAFLMVMPIIMQNLLDGFDAIDNELLEVCRIFELSFWKKMKILVIPTLIKYFIPATITATGLAWKSEIAAEIIAYTKNSIGEKINNAKYFYDSPTVFAWTVIIIFMSILLESITKHLLRRCKK